MHHDQSSTRPQSWEHLLHDDPREATGFRIGLAAAAAIHLGIFAVTWPTVAQAPPAAPEPELIPIRLVDVRPPEPERPPPIDIEIPTRSDEASIIVPGPPEEIPTDPIERALPAPQIDGPHIVVAPVDFPPAPPDPPPTVVRAHVEVTPPAVLDEVTPLYTEAARHAGIQGVVILDLVIAADGAVESIAVLRGLPLGLTQNAVSAVKQWRFAPSFFNGRPVRVRYTLTVRFTLSSHRTKARLAPEVLRSGRRSAQ
jgi:protein TonB